MIKNKRWEQNSKVCLYNEKSGCVQIVTKFVYNKLKADRVIQIISDIRCGVVDKNKIYVCSYTYRDKHGKYAVLCELSFTGMEYAAWLQKMQNNYNRFKPYIIKGENLI